MLLKSKLIYGLQSPSSPPSIFISYFCRFLSTSLPSPSPVTGNAPSEPNFAVEYLIKSCGFPSEKATKLSRYLTSLDSPSNPDSVLRFLKQSGVSNADIRSAVSLSPQLLCSSVDNNLRFRVKELQEMGFSPAHISQFVSVCPDGFKCINLEQKIKFLLPILGSVEMLLKVMKRSRYLLTSNLEKVIVANISFLQEHCQLSACELLQHCALSGRLITFSPDKLKDIVQRAKSLGIPCSSGRFKNALSVVGSLSQRRLDAKVSFLKSVGWLGEEVSSMIRKQPQMLAYSENKIRSNIDFLTKEVGLKLSGFTCSTYLFQLSLEQRLIPRHYVLSTLRSKGLPEGRLSFKKAVLLNEKKFTEKFVLPFNDIVPGLSEAYAAACAGKAQVKGKK